MIAYFGGAEVPVYRELMHERGVLRMSLNYVSFHRRVQTPDWSITEHYPPGSRIFVDSGARAYNRAGIEVPTSEIEALANNYYAFISTNVHDIDGYLEFDANSLSPEFRQIQRAHLHPGKGVVVWHSEDGIEELERLCALYQRVAVSEKSLADDSLVPVYRRLARVTHLHLLGADRSLMVPEVAWYSCHFSSWISAQQRGETFVWAGHELRRYDASQKEKARRRHRVLFESLGLSAEKIAADDSTENLKLALWSWGQHFANLERPIGTPVTRTSEPSTSETPSRASEKVEGTSPDWEHDVVTGGAPKPRDKRLLPGLGATTHTAFITDPESGSRVPREELRVFTADPGIRNCNGCFLAAKCPAYEPGSSCAYNIPVRVSTKEQRAALFDAIIEMQAQRVFFMRMAEEGDGGYADKALSAEIDRLRNLLKIKDDMEAAGFTLTVKAQQRGDAQTGLLTRLFGRDSEPMAITASAPEAELSAEEALRAMGVVDAEVISDTVTG